MAPVKAPFSCPNRALSTSPSGMAAQLMEMNGPSCRGLPSWMARATSSLPVPDSPSSSTVALVGATVPMVSMTRRNGWLSPTSARVLRNRLISRRNCSFSRRSRTTSSACVTAISSVSGRIGLVR